MSQIYTPHKYQIEARDFILDVPRNAIWMPMGMGKTSSTLTAISEIMLYDEDPILVLAPLRVARSTWPEEVRKWKHLQHLRVSPICGTAAERRFALKQPADIYTMNYDNLVWLVETLGDAWPFKHVVCDESPRLKSFRLRQGGKRAQALAKVAHRKVKRITELTGTPVPNGLIDLWGQMWFLDAGQRLGRTYTGFVDRWFQASPDGFGVKPLESAQVKIQQALKDICLTISAEDHFKLEAPIVSNIFVELPPRARAMYNDMEKKMFMQLDEHGIEAFNAAAKTQKLLQLSSGAIYLDATTDTDGSPNAKEWKEVHNEKLKALENVVNEASGAPVLVAYHFRSDLARLKKHFPQARELDARPATLDEWNRGEIPMLLAHPQSAGHGLNLQHGGNILVYFSHNWSLENRMQILERIGPMRQMQSGYKRAVFVYNIIARDTMDEQVIERIESKREIQDILLEAMRKLR